MTNIHLNNNYVFCQMISLCKSKFPRRTFCQNTAWFKKYRIMPLFFACFLRMQSQLTARNPSSVRCTVICMLSPFIFLILLANFPKNYSASRPCTSLYCISQHSIQISLDFQQRTQHIYSIVLYSAGKRTKTGL